VRWRWVHRLALAYHLEGKQMQIDRKTIARAVRSKPWFSMDSQDHHFTRTVGHVRAWLELLDCSEHGARGWNVEVETSTHKFRCAPNPTEQVFKSGVVPKREATRFLISLIVSGFISLQDCCIEPKPKILRKKMTGDPDCQRCHGQGSYAAVTSFRGFDLASKTFRKQCGCRPTKKGKPRVT